MTERLAMIRDAHRRLSRRDHRFCAWCGKKLNRLQRSGRYCSPLCQKRAIRCAGGKGSLSLTKEEMARLDAWLKQN
jgi:hypothetical protein